MKRFKVTPVVSQTSSKTGAFVVRDGGADDVATASDVVLYRKAGVTPVVAKADAPATKRERRAIFIVDFDAVS